MSQAEETVVTSVEGLREIYRPPGERALAKQIDRLDDHCRDFIAHSPFFVLATADASGRCDASPKGGPPGFVQVLDDDHLAFADLSGNNRLDSLQNLVANAGVGMLFMIPGMDETLRVNGRAEPTTDPDVLQACVIDDVHPRLAIRVEVHEAFIHCAKAFRRSALWSPDAWPDRSDMSSAACMLRDHAKMTEVTVEEVQAALEASYQKALWRPGG